MRSGNVKAADGDHTHHHFWFCLANPLVQKTREDETVILSLLVWRLGEPGNPAEGMLKEDLMGLCQGGYALWSFGQSHENAQESGQGPLETGEWKTGWLTLVYVENRR